MLSYFRELWCCDFEYHNADKDPPSVVCMVAREVRSGRLIKLWQDDLNSMTSAPFPTDPGVLFVAFYASAEISCFLELGWALPERVLDLFTEHRCATNGNTPLGPAPYSLLGCLAYHDLTVIAPEEKTALRDLVLSGGPWSRSEREAIINYCRSDVGALVALLPVMVSRLGLDADVTGLQQALFRGRYMVAVARMERAGTPLDASTLARLKANWVSIKDHLIAEVDKDYGVYVNGSFNHERFENYIASLGMRWPKTQLGHLKTSSDTFAEMKRISPEVAPLAELIHTLGQLHLNDLHVGKDNRNRVMLSPFRSKTGRNQPSNSKFIFGPSAWLRSLMKPAEGYGLAYLDFGSQEIIIAAALSGDKAMVEAYHSGDPYLSFGKQAGLIPPGGTKVTHKAERQLCKGVVLGVGYGMSAAGMSGRLGITQLEAGQLLRKHKETYPQFWRWSERIIHAAMSGRTLFSPLGWQFRFQDGVRPNPRSAQNWPMQAGGADMLRLAACEATEAGLTICAPIHDALLLEAPLDVLDDHIDRLRKIMEDASAVVMSGEMCRVDAEIVRYPDRYIDERAAVFWPRMLGILEVCEHGRS